MKVAVIHPEHATALLRNCMRAACLLFLSSTLCAQTGPAFSVVIDHQTFYPQNLKSFQDCGDKVAAEVDKLIPGKPLYYPSGGIIVFDGPPQFFTAPLGPVPIALSDRKYPGEPVSTKAGTVRIALYGVQGNPQGKFVFQLAHELAHVKMGAKISNSVIEAFATAVSFEVLKKLSLDGYLIETTKFYFPEDVWQQITRGDIPTLRNLWQSRCGGTHWGTTSDTPLNFLGAILLRRAGQPRWNLLLNVSELAADRPIPMKMLEEFAKLPPDIPAMTRRGIQLEALGYDSPN